jgi:hypothetical protein
LDRVIREGFSNEVRLKLRHIVDLRLNVRE